LSITLICSTTLFGQHSITVQNNTALDYNFQVAQSGNIVIGSNQYTVMNTLLTAYANDMAMLEFDPDTVMSPGDTVYFDGLLTSANDTIVVQMQVAMGNAGHEVFYSGAGPGFDLAWSDDFNFHDAAFVSLGAPYAFRFKRTVDMTDNDDDVLFAVQEDFIYSIDSSDFSNPGVINVMSYNIQMTPIVSFNFFERATYFPELISAYQDIVVVQEVFEDMTRINDLTPAMVAAGFPYYTTVLNDTALSYITTPTNGGVLIYSRWPIEAEAEIKYANCSNNGAWDCLASKGVKYARVNKLGKLYHVFGTHMEAGGSTADVQYRLEQYGEIANFMDTLSIPADEAVIIAGDLNTGPKDGMEYDSLRSNTNPIIPQHTGYFESTFSYADTGRIIDHVWGQADHLHPITSENKVITFRSVDSVMWGIFDFSDHRTVLGRFLYPDIQPGPFVDTALCAGDSLTLSVGSSDPLIYQWTLDGTDITGANANTYTINGASASVKGTYDCEVTNYKVYGNQGDVLSLIFYPEGPDTLEQTYIFTIAAIGYQDPCGVGVPEEEQGSDIVVVPSPSDGRFELRIADFEKYEQMELFNSVGSLVASEAVTGPSMHYDIAAQGEGVYFVRLTGKAHSAAARIILY